MEIFGIVDYTEPENDLCPSVRKLAVGRFDHMPNKKILESKDGKCPYCLSDYVFRVTEDEKNKISDLLPEGTITVWKCYKCNKYFFTRT